MNRILPLARMALVILSFALCSSSFAQLPAFPGAEGFGKFATGGRYGSVYHVTNLNNSGAGSLRDAVSTPNRIVVFDVAGVIKITERMIVASNIYLAGQTAPGEGITVYGNGWSFSNSHNTICRYIKIRMGIVGSSGVDANGLASGHDIIFDHCSVSWGRDENFSINSTTAQNITIQNCIISQGLLTHSAGGLIQCDGGITLYRNLYADNGTRNNKVKGVSQYVNNIVYNWSAGAYIMGGESSGSSYVNVTNNCFIQGPVDGVRPLSSGNSTFHIYATDNIYDNNRDGAFNPYTVPQSEYEGPPDFQTSPYAYPTLPTVPANTLLTNLLPTVGASLPYRDYADYYVVNEVKSFGKRGELIANESTLPFGAPTSWTLWAGTARTDSDNDGMPDVWETANGTNPAVNDAMIITPSGYTNIENYINSISANSSQNYLRTPLKLKQDSATQNTIYLSWLDYTEKEDGYMVERKINGVWTQIATTAVNENTFAVTGLQPEESGTFRVKAFNASMQSGYSNELTGKAKPVEVPVLDPATFTPDLTWTGAVNGDWDKVTNNWVNTGNVPAAFTDSSKLLFPESGSGKTVNITAQMGARDILVNSNGNYTFSGPGFIAGGKSLNKTGNGTLSLQTNNTYTGATVLRSGRIEFNKLANGGAASSIGASANYGFNWVWKGGQWVYTGGNANTDRNAIIDATTEFNVSNSASAVTFTGVLSGDGGLVKSGPGKLTLRSVNPYAGETVIKGGTLEVSPISSATLADDIIDNGVALGTSNVLRLHNGTFKNSNGSSTLYENYPMQLYVEDGTINGFEPYRLANLLMTVHGSGTLNYTIPYLRELVQGDWSDFTGSLVANGVNTDDTYSLLAIDNGVGFPSNRVVTTGNTKIIAYDNNRTLYLGGLSGNAGTWLSCGGTKSPSFGNGFTTYIIGGMGTDETFNGIINNHLYGNAADGSGTTTIVKEGSGLWRLTGNNTYIGTTTITGGKLIVNGTNSGTGKVTVNEGTTLAGKGSIAGAVEVAGTLEPGDASINTLTLKDKLTLQSTATTSIDIDKTTGTWDKVSVTSNIVYNGTLQINLTGTPASGDKFKIFTTSATASGAITQFEPAVPGPGLLWKFNELTGELSVQTPNFVETPTGLILNATTSIPTATSTVNINWTDNSDNEDYFILERGTDGNTFVDIAYPAANATDYVDANLTPNTKYYYRIKAHSPLNESAYSSVVSVTTPASTTMPTVPSAPSPANNAQNVFLTNSTVNFTWTGNYAETYSLYLGTTSDALTKVADVPAATSTYGSPVLAPNTKYFWRVDATNANGTTTGTIWNFKTANVPATVAGDYRTKASGNWGSGTVNTAIWETFNGASWVATTTLPTSSTPTITVRTGHTVRLNATTTVNNVVVESGGILISGTTTGATGTATVQNLRVASSVNNFGTVGSSSTSTDRVNFEGTRNNGTIYVTGTSTYFLNTFSVHSMAQNLEIIVDANLNLSSFLRAFSTTSPSDNAQNDDNVTVTISEGKTVTMGSSGYLHIQSSGNTNATNTISAFGNYTYNINGTLDMRSTGTTAIVAHSTLPRVITINTNGNWMLGNAMRLVPATGSLPVGSLNLNIGPNGVVDAGARTIGSSNTATNLVVTNSSMPLTQFFNTSGGGLLKSRVATSEVLFPIGSDNTYSPVKLLNSGTADIIGAGVATGFDKPVTNASRMVNKQYSIVPATAGVAKLDISLGWVTADQGASFNPSIGVAQARYNSAAWVESPAAASGAGTAVNPYYAKVLANTLFGSFVVTNPSVPPVVVTKNITAILDQTGHVTIAPADVDNGSTDDYAIANMALDKTAFDCSNVGENTVTLTVTDIHGNQSTGTATVLVKDETTPTVATKGITVNLSGGIVSISASDINNGSADACGIQSMSIDKSSFDCSNVGENTVTLTVTDNHGNKSTGTATVLVKDVTAPSVVTKNITVNLSGTGSATITAADVNNGSSDVCGVQSLSIDKTSFDCSHVGENTVTLTVIDVNGNQSTGTATVTIKDVTAPTVVTKNITVSLSGGIANIAAADIDNGSSDACDIQSMSIDKTHFTCTSIGTHEVTLTVVDIHNNQASAKAIVTVIGAIPQPNITVSRNDQTYTGGSATTVFLGYGAQQLNLNATDATSAFSQFAWTPSALLLVANSASTVFAPTTAGSYTYSVTATNEYGCSASASVAATVIDVRCGTKLNKVMLCHKGREELCIGSIGVQDHMAHGDKLGSCDIPVVGNVMGGSENGNQNSGLNITPNPATSITTVSFTLLKAGKYKLELFNANGVRVELLQESVSIGSGTTSYQFDASRFTPGMYLVRVTANNSILSKQIVIQ